MKFYVTTPIYYPNDAPHIGHAYTTLAADILTRWHKIKEDEVFFLTGTDEHGKKIELAAKKKKKMPKEFVDSLVPTFKDAWKKLNIDYTRFVRTTDLDHVDVVQEIIKKVHSKGDIYKGTYEGFYCTACEAYYTEKDLVEGKCPVHKTKIEKLKEESYFFKLSKYQRALMEHFTDNPDFISPRNKREEVVNRVREDLQDLSISRTSFKWGIPFPIDKKHITYVWFDALTNYLTGIGYLEDKELFKKFWPADVHIVGKDILWFHAVIWPAMLMSAGISLPKKIFAHGWWTISKEKISKSRGKVIGIDELIKIAGVDAARYFLFRETPFGDDGDFSVASLKERYNNELANKFGNLVSRITALADKHGIEKSKNELLKSLNFKRIDELFEKLEFDKILNEIFAFIDRCNEYVQSKKLWATGDQEAIYEVLHCVKAVAILLYPFIPETSEKIAKHLDFEISYSEINDPLEKKRIIKADALFKKV